MDVVGTWRAERVTCRRWGTVLIIMRSYVRSCVRSCYQYVAPAFSKPSLAAFGLCWRFPLRPCPACSAKAADGSVGAPPDATVQCQCAMLPIEARWTSANSTEPEDSQTRSTALLNSGHICRGYIAVKNRYCNCFSWCNKEGWLHTAQDVMAHGSISCR